MAVSHKRAYDAMMAIHDIVAGNGSNDAAHRPMMDMNHRSPMENIGDVDNSTDDMATDDTIADRTDDSVVTRNLRND